MLIKYATLALVDLYAWRASRMGAERAENELPRAGH